MALYTLVYTSTSTRDMSTADLKDILATANERNAGIEVTGMLLYHDGNFIQVLEGTRDTVETLYGMIKTDLRHENLNVMWDGEISERQFADWAMGFRDTSGEDLSELSGYTDWMTKPDAPWTPAQRETLARALLVGFKRSAHRAAEKAFS